MNYTPTDVLVTVLVDTWNHEDFIERALDSVIAQDFDMSRVEIIVVDDGSTDGTPARIAKYHDRILYISKENGGQASAFNVGIPMARGRFIAFLDGDDWWREDKLRRVIGVLQERPGVGFVGHAITETDGESWERLIAPRVELEFNLSSAQGATFLLKNRCFMGTSRMAGQTALFRGLLPVPNDLIVEADEYFFTLVPALAKVVILAEPLCYYRLHSGNLYQFSGHNPKRLRLKSRVHTCLARVIPAKLSELKISAPAAEVIRKSAETEARRLHLAAFGGPPGSALGVEWRIMRQKIRDGDTAISPVKWLMLMLALLLPGGLFYRVRSWWSIVRTKTHGGAVSLERIV